MHGHLMHKKGKEKYDYYICTSKVTFEPCNSKPVRKDRIERIVLERLKSIIMDKSVLNNLYEEVQAQLFAKSNTKNIELSAIAKKISNNEKQLNRVLAAIKDIGHSRMLLIELNLLEAQQLELNQQLSQMKAVVPPVLSITFDDIIANIQTALEMANEQQRGILVRGFVKRIEVERYDGVINGKMSICIMDTQETIMPLATLTL